MKESDYQERRIRLYHRMFEEYNSLYITYKKFFVASDALAKRARLLTYTSTISSGTLLFIIGAVMTTNAPSWGANLAFALSIVVAGLSFINAVDDPQRMSNVCYNSGQILQEVYFDFEHMVTVRLPDPTEDLDTLEEDCKELMEKKNIVNESTPQIGNKWYNRVKEKNDTDWKPKPLSKVNGKEDEFIDGSDKDEVENIPIYKIHEYGRKKIEKVFRWMGY